MRLRPETSPEVEKAIKDEKIEKGETHQTDAATFDEPIPSIDEQLASSENQ